MERKTKIDQFEIFVVPEWRAKINILPTIGKGAGLESFRTYLNWPLENLNITPEEIKKETLEKLITVMEIVIEELKKLKI